MGRVIRPDRESDGGFTLVEVVLAIAILTVAVAATTAAISLAATARRDGGVQITAAEIANEVLQQAEAFGCGLPVDYNGVSATDRLRACDYNGSETGGDGLADVDFTTVRDDHSFDVEVRMRWYSLDLPPHTNFFNTEHQCKRQADWANGRQAGQGSEYPTDAIDPTLLSRTVTVKAPNDRVTVLESTETVRPELADPHHSGFVFRTTNANQEMRLYQKLGSNDQYTMTFHSDSQSCAWIPYLEYSGSVSYVTSEYSENSNTWSADKNQALCDDALNTTSSKICHEQFSP